MKKKITKLIESSLPNQVYDKNGEPVNRRKIADKVYDAIPNIERLDLAPFQIWIPSACAGCHYNEAYKLGCTFELSSEKIHNEHSPPDNCPNGFSS